jgi:hypothetical protein
MTSRPGSELWGIGRYEDCSGRPVPWAISSADLHADADFARRRLEAFGLTRGDVVLVVGLYSEAAQLGPVEMAIRQLGGRHLVRRAANRRLPPAVESEAALRTGGIPA